MINNYTLTQLAHNEYRDFALYTVEKRAIPSLIDGLKPSQRFYLYSSNVSSVNSFKKVSAIGGVVSDYGFNHGENSVSDAGQLMAADWANNVCLIEGQGSFGTRLVRDPSAHRYTFTRLHENFFKFYKDTNLAPEHDDPEHEPPKFYIPIIPMVLVNGIEGIGTGYATKIFPRSVSDVKKACNEYLKSGTIKNRVGVSFPKYKGKTIYNEKENRYYSYGVFERKTKTKLVITEIPYSFDRKSYIKVLDDLEDKNMIVSYTDTSNEDGFCFNVTLKQDISKVWIDKDIIKHFKLVKTYTENLTFVDQNGSLCEFDDERDVIKSFCEFRLTIYTKRKNHLSKAISKELNFLYKKIIFVDHYSKSSLNFAGKKKAEIYLQVKSDISDNVTNEYVLETPVTDEDVKRLLSMSIDTLTPELVTKLKKLVVEKEEELNYIKTTSEKDLFYTDLKGI